MSDEVKYTTENQEFKYIKIPNPFVWNIFEKHRGKRVFNVPNDLAFCAENPDLVLKSDYDTLKKELGDLKAETETKSVESISIGRLKKENEVLRKRLEKSFKTISDAEERIFHSLDCYYRLNFSKASPEQCDCVVKILRDFIEQELESIKE